HEDEFDKVDESEFLAFGDVEIATNVIIMSTPLCFFSQVI
ncbi:16459_t:CDS:1, partial [Cetraspora pellucida]